MARNDDRAITDKVIKWLPRTTEAWHTLTRARIESPRAELYRLSYEGICRVFHRDGQDPGKEEWALRFVCLSGWLGTVLQPTLEDGRIKTANRVLAGFRGKRLWRLDKEEQLLDSKWLGRKVLAPIAALLSRSKYGPPISSISKLLHFACPEVFPILDHMIAKTVFGLSSKSPISPRMYCRWMAVVRAAINENPGIFAASKSLGMSPIRLVEWAVFTIHAR